MYVCMYCMCNKTFLNKDPHYSSGQQERPHWPEKCDRWRGVQVVTGAGLHLLVQRLRQRRGQRGHGGRHDREPHPAARGRDGQNGEAAPLSGAGREAQGRPGAECQEKEMLREIDFHVWLSLNYHIFMFFMRYFFLKKKQKQIFFSWNLLTELTPSAKVEHFMSKDNNIYCYWYW